MVVGFALRGNRADRDQTDAPKTDPGAAAGPRTVVAAGVLPPPAVSLPDGAAAAVVISPREVWRRADLRPGSRPATFLTALEQKYRFDPRRYDRLTVAFPPALAPYMVPKGSIAIDGISLTIAALGQGRLDVMVLPYTLEHTNIKAMKIRDRVNLECDMIGKYVVRAAELAGLTLMPLGEAGK